MSYFQRPSLRNDTFEPPQNVDSNMKVRSSLAMAFNERNSDRSSYFSQNEPAPLSIDEDLWDRYADYSNRIHSIHRNKQYNTNSDNLFNTYEARTGGLAGRTMRRNFGKGNVEAEQHANRIVQKMTQDPALIEDSVTSEQLRREALRDMPQCLTIKRSVKEKLLHSVKRKPKKLTCFKMFKYRISMFISNCKENIMDLMYSFELWYSSLKKVEGNFGTGVASFFKFLRWLFLLNLLIAIFSVSFIVIPQVVYSEANNKTQLNKQFSASDLFTGEGYFTDTILYYGFYSDTSVSMLSLHYDMPQAYFFTMISIYIACFLILSYSAAKSYRTSFIETEGGLKNVFANKIFCGWDYNIANEDAAQLKSRAVYNDLKELISASLQEEKQYSCINRFWTISIRVTVNILFLLVVSLTGYLLWSLQEHGSVIVAIIANLVMTLLPIIFTFIVRYEAYENPKSMLYMNLARTFILGFVIVGVLIIFWLESSTKNECWETALGQEVYRLILFDFFFSIILTAVFDCCQYCIYRCFYKENLEFDIARNTMQIMYNQTLFWVGFFVSPILPVVVVIKLFIAWYIKLFVALKLCRAPGNSWRAAQTSTWFLVMTFLSLLLVEGLYGYLITDFRTSDSCGPFNKYNYSFEIVTDGILSLKEDSRVWKVLLYLTTPGFIAFVLIGLCVATYFIRAKALAQKELVERYREFLLWAARDKEVLLQHITNVTKGQWKYKLNESRDVDPIRTAPHNKNVMSPEMGDQAVYSEPSSSGNFMTSEEQNRSGASLESDDQLYSKYKKYS